IGTLRELRRVSYPLQMAYAFFDGLPLDIFAFIVSKWRLVAQPSTSTSTQKIIPPTCNAISAPPSNVARKPCVESLSRPAFPGAVSRIAYHATHTPFSSGAQPGQPGKPLKHLWHERTCFRP